MDTTAVGSALRISKLGLGTVELGLRYGPPDSEQAPPDRDDAIDLIHQATRAGITWFDTAPGYGHSEQLLGQALGREAEATVATKVHVPAGTARVEDHVRASVSASCKRLGQETLDIVQLHNATPELLEQTPALATLHRLRDTGQITAIGATVYTAEEAHAAIHAPGIDLVQLPFNLLDRRPSEDTLPRAEEQGVTVVARSVLLKGVLTPSYTDLPARLGPLRKAVDEILETASCHAQDLPTLAIRYAMHAPGIDAIVLGLRNRSELTTAIDAAKMGPLPPDLQEALSQIHVLDPDLLDPSTWNT